MSFLYYRAINWNETQDTIDQYTWEKLTNYFWLDTRIPVLEDRLIWDSFSKEKQNRIGRLLAGASLNTALQSEFGAASLRRGIQTQQEEAVLNIMTFMESVHTKAFTTIYRAFITDAQAEEYYHFADHEPLLAEKTAPFEQIFATGNHLQKKAAFIVLETALTFGQYAPVLTEEALFQTNQMIAHILRGSGLFTAYLGYKFQRAFQSLPNSEKKEFTDWLAEFMTDAILMEANFFEKTAGNLAPLANALLYFGANYALESLGFEARFRADLTPSIQQQLTELLTTSEQLAQQAQMIQNSQLEAMANDDYEF